MVVGVPLAPLRWVWASQTRGRRGLDASAASSSEVRRMAAVTAAAPAARESRSRRVRVVSEGFMTRTQGREARDSSAIVMRRARPSKQESAGRARTGREEGEGPRFLRGFSTGRWRVEDHRVGCFSLASRHLQLPLGCGGAALNRFMKRPSTFDWVLQGFPSHNSLIALTV
jgi:hypothetical protein